MQYDFVNESEFNSVEREETVPQNDRCLPVVTAVYRLCVSSTDLVLQAGSAWDISACNCGNREIPDAWIVQKVKIRHLLFLLNRIY